MNPDGNLAHRITIQYAVPASPEDFDTHYREVHIPLARLLPGLQRITMSNPRAGGGAPYLVTELWFASAEELRTALKSPEMAAAAADAAQLCERTGSILSTFTGEVLTLVE